MYADQPEDFNYKVLEACNKLEWRQRRAWMLNSGGGKTGTDIILSHTVEPQNPTFPKDKNKCLHIKNIAKWTVAWCDSYMFYHLTSESAVFSETWWMVTLSWHHWLGPVGLHHMLILQHTESCGCSVTCFFFVIKVFLFCFFFKLPLPNAVTSVLSECRWLSPFNTIYKLFHVKTVER